MVTRCKRRALPPARLRLTRPQWSTFHMGALSWHVCFRPERVPGPRLAGSLHGVKRRTPGDRRRASSIGEELVPKLGERPPELTDAADKKASEAGPVTTPKSGFPPTDTPGNLRQSFACLPCPRGERKGPLCLRGSFLFFWERNFWLPEMVIAQDLAVGRARMPVPRRGNCFRKSQENKTLWPAPPLRTDNGMRLAKAKART